MRRECDANPHAKQHRGAALVAPVAPVVATVAAVAAVASVAAVAAVAPEAVKLAAWAFSAATDDPDRYVPAGREARSAASGNDVCSFSADRYSAPTTILFGGKRKFGGP